MYNNHLQSASLELDGSANIISYEEYHPYGITAFQAKNAGINAVAKRYRYTGKERDEESGLYYHGARYYIPWLCRWNSTDPMESKYAGMSPYNYSFNNPVMFNDPSGMEGEEVHKGNWVRTADKRMVYNSLIDNLDGAIRTYGEGAKLRNVGYSYSSNTHNDITLGMNGRFTKNGELQTSPDDRANYVEDNFKFTNLGRAFEAQRRAEAAAESYFLKTKFLLADGSTMTGTQIRRAEYERVEAGGAAIRNGFFGAAGALTYQATGLDPMRGAVVFSVFDGAAMFAAGNAGAPYGRVSPVSQLNKPSFTIEQKPIEWKAPMAPVKYDPRFAVSQGLEGGRFNFDKIRSMIPEATPNTFNPSYGGEKYIFRINETKIQLKWHTPEFAGNAPVGSNSSLFNTAQISVGKKFLLQNGQFSKNYLLNEAHIPLK